jgi:hypothetical protein
MYDSPDKFEVQENRFNIEPTNDELMKLHHLVQKTEVVIPQTHQQQSIGLQMQIIPGIFCIQFIHRLLPGNVQGVFSGHFNWKIR